LLWIAAACAAPAPAQQNPFLGKWDITRTPLAGENVFWLEVKQDGGALTGSFLNRTGSVYKLPQITIENGELTFPLSGRNVKPVFRAKIQGGKLIGTISSPSSEVISVVGVRAPDWGTFDANGKHKFDRAIELFNGRDIDNWGVQFKDKSSGWSVADGLMVNSAGANNLVTKDKFKDFEVHAEYKLEKNSNSGLYLRGRYELQILDDYGKPADIHSHMSVYSRVAPLVNASKPPGEWQTVDATIVDNRVTARLNGQLVQDNTVIDGVTGGALDADEASPGPIMLQGDHGRIWVRKLTVTPIK
jgi:hypothetical protein